MFELVAFSFKRRFKNKSTMIFNGIIFLVIGVIFFGGELLRVINPSMFETTYIYTKGIAADELTYLNSVANENYEFKELKGSIKQAVLVGDDVLEQQNGYILHSKYAKNKLELNAFSMYLTQYRRDGLLMESGSANLIADYQQVMKVKNDVYIENVDISEEKSTIIFVLITSIYFMMVSFISAVAGEVVHEKSTKTLELILTSVSAKTHFLSKMITGWLIVVAQTCMNTAFVLFWFVVRLLYDKGEGLLAFVNELHILQIPQQNLYQLIASFDIDLDLITRVICCLLFLMLGILMMQLLMVIVSSFVSSVEEAGSIQAPFYLILLGIYYLTLALNNPQDLSEGWGMYLSFVPFFNMLFMPCRLLIQHVPLIELSISLLFSSLGIYLLIKKGVRYYEVGVLDYSNANIIEILKTKGK
ncbi:MAG: ABC transporter permease [Breznakia sp.]